MHVHFKGTPSFSHATGKSTHTNFLPLPVQQAMKQQNYLEQKHDLSIT